MDTFIELLPDLIVALFVAAGALCQFLNYKKTGKLSNTTAEVANASVRLAKKLAPEKKTVERLYLKIEGKEVDVTDLLQAKKVEVDE